jgi:undecaprenol kinase
MKKWLNSAGHALRGISFLIRTERNFQIELILGIVAILFGYWLQIAASEWCIILLCIAGVLSAEAFNTAFERMADFQSMEIHPEIKSIKDIAAGAVMIMAIVAAVIGMMIFGPALLEKFL